MAASVLISMGIPLAVWTVKGSVVATLASWTCTRRPASRTLIVPLNKFLQKTVPALDVFGVEVTQQRRVEVFFDYFPTGLSEWREVCTTEDLSERV